ncbi:MAG: nitrile hydratase subunit beta [Proteobacteria bacterium]|nr:nitrile hydratase subunit beta [Pseudomonadota bacterium]MDA1058313.1 nitrile hydratase subunit beta [Pseudomonadota bacterium]
MPGPHDLGGVDFGPVDLTEHTRSAWDNRVDAMQRTLREQGHWSVDELRRAIESLSPGDYLSFTYYQKWLSAIHLLLIEKGLLDREEILARIAKYRGADR